MKNGEPHLWNMLFTSDDIFVWVRQDWVIDDEIHGSTQARRRCTMPMS